MSWNRCLLFRNRLAAFAALLFGLLAAAPASAATGVVIHIPSSVTMFSNPLYATYASTQNSVSMHSALREKLKQTFWRGWTGKATGGAAGGCIVGTITGGAALAQGVWESRLIVGRLLAGCAGGAAAGVLGQTAALALASLSAPGWAATAGGLVVTGGVGLAVVTMYDYLFNTKDPGTRRLLAITAVTSHGRATAMPGASYDARYRAYFQKEFAFSHSLGVDWVNSAGGDFCWEPGNCFYRNEAPITYAHMMW